MATSEGALFADVLGLLLADIRRNRAARLAAQARAGVFGVEDTPDDESDFTSAMRQANQHGADDETG